MSTVRAAGAGGPVLTRRAVLALGPAAAVAACGRDRPAPRPAPVAPAPVADPDTALRAAAAARERALLRRYDLVLRAHPALSARLRPLRAHHAVHLAMLLGPAPSPSPSPSASASAGPPPAVPPRADAAAALRGLVAAERAAGTAHARDCLAASRELAGVLAQLSASELSHPVALG